MKNSKITVRAAPQPCRRREAAGWRASQTLKKGFVGFAGFVTKQIDNQTTIQQNKS